MSDEQEEPKFGSPTPLRFSSGYDPRNSTPYYTEHHKKFRATLREFDKDVLPHVDEWEVAGEIPIDVPQGWKDWPAPGRHWLAV